MGLIDAFGVIAPGWTARYLMRRAELEAVRKYEAAMADNYRPRRASVGDGDLVAGLGAERLRNTARYLEENHDLVVGILDDLVNNTIADGVRVEPMVRRRDGSLHEEFNRAIRDAYDELSESPETTGEHSMLSLDRLAARSLFRDGEVFGQLIRDPRFRYATPLPFVVDMLEADLCPISYNDDARSVVQGIERDAWFAPRGYWFYKRHPAGMKAGLVIRTEDMTRRDAGAILHPKLTKRIKQGRGVTALHAVIGRLRDVKDYEESERIAAKVASDLTGFIQRTDGAGQIGAVRAGETKRSLKMQAGTIFELLPGESIGTISSDRPNTGLESFRKAMLRAVAAGTGTRGSSISRDYDHTYSAARQELVEGAVGYRALFGYLVGAWKRPIYQAFVEAAVLGGLVPTPRDVDMATLYRAQFRAPALPWIDPQKEANAWKTLLDAELESRAGVSRMRGVDWDAIASEIEQEEERGFGISPAPAAPAPSDQGAVDENGDPVEDQPSALKGAA